MDCGWITDRQIEAARVAMTRSIKRGGKVWIRLFPDKPITKKPAETRMGKGKGAPEQWVAVIRPGKILFEMEGVDRATAPSSHAAGGAQAAHPDQVRQRGKTRSKGMMKAQKVRDLDDTELQQQLQEMDEQIFRLQFQMSMGQMDGLKKVRGDAEGPGAHSTRSCASGNWRRRRSNMAEQSDRTGDSRTRRSARWFRPRCRRPSWWK